MTLLHARRRCFDVYSLFSICTEVAIDDRMLPYTSGAMRDRAPGLAARSIHADNQLDNRNTMDFQTDDDILR
jgi:hypothetical protein